MAAVGAEMKRPAEGDGLASPRKKARKNSPDPRGDASEGGGSDGVDEGEVDSDGDSKEPDEAGAGAGPASSWNSGVTNKLRTSFGTSSQPAEPPQNAEPGQGSQPPLTTEVRDELAAAFRADEKRTGSPVSGQDLDWTLPALKADSVVGDTWSEVLDSMLDKWCPEFVAANQANVDQVGLGGSLLKKAFNHRLKKAPNLSPALLSTLKLQVKLRFRETRLTEFAPGFKPDLGKDMGKGTRREAKERAKESIELNLKKDTILPENPTRIQPSRRTKGQDAISEPTNPSTSDSSSPSAGIDMENAVEANEDNVQSTDLEMTTETADIKDGSGQLAAGDELEQRHRYYPGLPDNAVFCLTCASYEHATTDCPETTCKFCQQDHFSYRCPSRQRCGKCKQLGHTKTSCKEKLAIAPGEGFLECAFCQAQDHEEESCTEIWQTYRPQVGNTRKVKSIPIFCYCCGAEGHFGSDCGLADRRLPPSETWSLAYASLYLDPASSEEAIAFKIELPQAAATSLLAPVIPGRSIKPQSHIIFEDSGDEGADAQSFVRAPATGPKRQGQIQITSNINFGASAGPSAQQDGGAQQDSMDVRHHRRQRQQQYKQQQQQQQKQQQLSLPPKPAVGPQKGNGPPNPPPGPASKKGKKKGGRSGNKAQQQPPLPSGPPPGNGGWRPQELMPQGQQEQQRGANRSRGRGGFSSLGRGGGRGGRGRRNN